MADPLNLDPLIADLNALVEDVADLKVLLGQINGAAVNVEIASHKNLMSQKAEVNRKLLQAAHEADAIRHEADAVRVGVMSAYHDFKGGVEGRRRR